MKRNRYEIQTIDATGLKEITCPHCSFTNKLPLRTLSLEALRKMQDTKKIHESMRKEDLIVGGKTLINPRAMVCSNCQKISLLKDSFSELFDYGEKKQERGNCMSSFIPYKDLLRGIEIILQNVNSLIESASLLHTNKKYLHSAIFSVLAFEETAKVQLLKCHCNKKVDLPMSEWKKLTRGGPSHKSKLRYFLDKELDKKDRESISTGFSVDQVIELFARYYVRLKLNTLYVNWEPRLKKWVWYPGEYTDKQQEEVSAGLLNSVRKRYEKYKLQS